MLIDSYFFDLLQEHSVNRTYSGILCLDRDGVIIKEKKYLKDPAKIEFIPGSIRALEDILKNNFFIAVISNQAGLARGFITESEFQRVNEKFIDLLKTANVLVNCIIYCPYHPDGKVAKFCVETGYRKPATGMYDHIRKYYKLVNNYGVYMVGDKKTDIEFGRNIGAKCILVETGYGAQEKKEVLSEYPEVVACKDLAEAIVFIENKKH